MFVDGVCGLKVTDVVVGVLQAVVVVVDNCV